MIFSGGEELTRVWRKDRRGGTNKLFTAVKETFRATMKEKGVTVGVSAVFQGHAMGMSYKPHVHCIVSGGGIDGEGRWIARVRYEESAMRRRFDSYLKEAGIGGDEGSVYVTYHRHRGRAIVGYLARTVHGMVMDLKEEVEVTEEKVRFTMRYQGRERESELKRAVFLERYFMHVPPAGLKMIRHWGLYAGRNGERLEAVRREVGDEEGEEKEEGKVNRCPECLGILIVGEEFCKGRVPREIEEGERIRGSPYRHGDRIEERTRCA